MAENGVEILGSLELDSQPGEIAGLLIIRSLMQAMQNLVSIQSKNAVINNLDPGIIIVS
nr:hypothetical protein [Calothrix rhizosoleniae]